MLLVLVILAVGWLVASRHISRARERVVTDAHGLDAGRLLELSLLGERREDLLWQATGDQRYRDRRDAELRAARELLPALREHATTTEEREIVREIMTRMPRVYGGTASGDPATRAALVDDLLASVDRFEVANRAQMAGTVAGARRLQADLTRWLAALVLLVALILAAGVLGIVGRVIKPVLALTRAAAAVGRGDFQARPVPRHDDELGRLVRTFNNMTADIAEREEGRLRFMAAVAHDLGNSVVAIGMAARLLRRDGPAGRDARRWVEMIGAGAHQLEVMVRDLTDNVQISTGRFALHRRPLDLTGLMRELTDRSRVVHEEHDLVFAGSGECRVSADADRLERVVLNLVSNAAKYSPRGTEIRVQVACEETRAVLTVADAGPGISPEDMAVIFQPFGRGGRAHDVARGSGLGLFVVKQIVEAHGGRIDVDSTVGAGTTVRIELPRLRE